MYIIKLVLLSKKLCVYAITNKLVVICSIKMIFTKTAAHCEQIVDVVYLT